MQDANSAQLYLLNAQVMTAMTLGGVSVYRQGYTFDKDVVS